MTFKSVAVFFALLLPIFGFSQSHRYNIDSLDRVIDEVKNDSLKIRTIINIANEIDRLDYNQAKKFAGQALEIANNNGWTWAQSYVYSSLAFIANYIGDYVNSLEYYNKALQIELLHSDTLSRAKSYNNIGNAYYELGKFEEAYFYTKKSYELSYAKNDTLLLAVSLHNMARIYSKLGRLDLALDYFNSASEYSKEANDLEGPVYNNLEIGNAYLLEGDYTNAKKYLDLALELNQSLDLQNLTPQIYHSMATVYLKSNRLDLATVYYDSALIYFQTIGNLFGRAATNLGKCKVLIERKLYNEANTLASKSLTSASELKAQILMLECYRLLSKIEEMKGDYKSALNYTREAQQTQDSLSNIDVISYVFENEFQMRSQKKDEEINKLKKMREESMSEIKRQQFIRNIFVVVFALTIVLLYSVYKSGRRKVEINELLIKHQEESAKRTVELEELNKVKDKFFSIISHDLRSPINSLAGLLDLMEKGQIKPEELPAITTEMRVQFNHTKNLINNLLDWTLLQMNKVAIKKESISLKRVVDENIRLLSTMNTKETKFINEVDDSITAMADNNMINLIFRNLILNGIKFTDNGGIIKISATKNEREITVTINDNGVGISQEVQKVLFEKTTGYSTRGTANEKGTGLGLILCKEFIERNGGKIWLSSDLGKGSTFYLTLPVS